MQSGQCPYANPVPTIENDFEIKWLRSDCYKSDVDVDEEMVVEVSTVDVTVRICKHECCFFFIWGT